MTADRQTAASMEHPNPDTLSQVLHYYQDNKIRQDILISSN